MDKTTVAALLGRPLTPTEDTNFTTYLKIARQNLDLILCTNLCDTEVDRVFDAREGYSTLWTDIFTDIDEVSIDGEVVTNYTVRQNDRRSGSWYNSLVFDERFTSDTEVEVSASWGFQTMPTDLQMVLAGLFGLITKKSKFDGTISSKKVEDFSISFNADTDLDDEFYNLYSKTINKYSNCDRIDLKSGSVC